MQFFCHLLTNWSKEYIKNIALLSLHTVLLQVQHQSLRSRLKKNLQVVVPEEEEIQIKKGYYKYT